MTNDTRSPVAPIEGFYAMLRNGDIARPKAEQWANRAAFFEGPLHWWGDGKSVDNNENFDIIATISPEAMALAADPRLFEMIAKADKMATSCEGLCDKTENLVKLADAACDYADSHCRAFPIATAPIKGLFLAWNAFVGDWELMTSLQLAETEERHFTHWAPLPPPPSNPPLPEVFTELGAALEKIKEGK